MTTACILVAAGRGDRLGPGGPKALRLLLDEPLLVHAVRAAMASGAVDLVAVAASPGDADEVRYLLTRHAPHLVVVPGGATRRRSVAAALAALPASVDVVLVHDAARCLAPPALFSAVAKAVLDGADAVVPALPVADTVKQVAGEVVVATLDRSQLRAVQTPQGFRRAVLEHAHATVDEDATDDAGMVERTGVAVRVVPGDEEAFKITRPPDLVFAEAVLVHRRADRP
ncbi:MAG TPA: 2-C-methyl-D-erythritol 4-phosphate cytidylyltransferase [Jiangellaceae bacterium]|nr:2-C-methyl-D-erythritol 4-phosphate cytidylyltransferase [Jiangellaceae bacterium]